LTQKRLNTLPRSLGLARLMLALEQALRPLVLIIVVVTLATTAAIPSPPASDPAPPPVALDERGAVKVEIQNVNLHVGDGWSS
jgi:hypothetical protein